MGVSLLALQRPGIADDNLGASENLLRGARRVELIDSTRVQTATNQERSFVFSPTLENQITVGGTETMHQRKLFTAHILYGHRFGSFATGRIENPVALVRALIRNRTVAPSTAAKTDYLLLQAAGIVRVDDYDERRGQMHLVKLDVAEDSLELLRAAVGGDESGPEGTFWLPGSTGFTTPNGIAPAFNRSSPALKPKRFSCGGNSASATARRRPLLMANRGEQYECRVARVLHHEGAVVRRAVDLNLQFGERFTVTDVDVLALTFLPSLRRQVTICECKTTTGSGPTAGDRILWGAGVRQLVPGADRHMIATVRTATDKSAR